MSMNQSDYADALAAALRAILPYAHSRAEDMYEAIETLGANFDEEHALWLKADKAVSEAYALLTQFDGEA